jgi:hypothetical protein
MNIVFSSTTQLATAIRAGHVSATEVLEAHLAQIATHNPTLNAIVTMDAERARERAREADKALARGEIWGSLHGVPKSGPLAYKSTSTERFKTANPCMMSVPKWIPYICSLYPQ